LIGRDISMSEKRFEEEGDNTEAGGVLGSILLSSDDGAWSGDVDKRTCV
jgi:hypothetical protein